MRDETRTTTMRNEATPSKEKPLEAGIVPTSTVLSGPIAARNVPPDPRSFRKATRLLARLPRWRKGRRRLYLLGVLAAPIPSFLLWHHLIGPDWWQGLSGIGVLMVVYFLAYCKIWDWWSVKYKRAISVVLKASAEQSVGPIIDACCLLSVSYASWVGVTRALIIRLGRITSPDDDSITDIQLTVLHDIVQGDLLPTSFDTDSLCILLNALVPLGDTRTVTCLEELVEGAGKPRKNEVIRAKAKQGFGFSLGLMGDAHSAASAAKLVRGGGKTRDPEVVRATAQQCLVRLQERLAAESLRTSLLRSSEPTSLHCATLLRPATTETAATPPEQLLRAHLEP